MMPAAPRVGRAGDAVARFGTVVLDVDSTLSEIEGIEWLAARRDPEITAKIAVVTEAAMRGDLPFEQVYGARLDLVRPTRAEVALLAEAYIDRLAPDATPVIATLRGAGVRVILVSGGLLPAILPLGAVVGIPSTDVHAVGIHFDANGEYAGFESEHPCARQFGKPTLVAGLDLPTPILAVGDGITDAELKPVVGAFAAFVGHIERDTVVAHADHLVRSFTEILPLVLS